jgi:hypothetical protein
MSCVWPIRRPNVEGVRLRVVGDFQILSGSFVTGGCARVGNMAISRMESRFRFSPNI